MGWAGWRKGASLLSPTSVLKLLAKEQKRKRKRGEGEGEGEGKRRRSNGSRGKRGRKQGRRKEAVLPDFLFEKNNLKKKLSPAKSRTFHFLKYFFGLKTQVKPVGSFLVVIFFLSHLTDLEEGIKKKPPKWEWGIE